MTVRILLNGIKLCKSNFYWVEFSDTQVEVRILLNAEEKRPAGYNSSIRQVFFVLLFAQLTRSQT